MGFLFKLALRSALNGAALWLAAGYIPGFELAPHYFLNLDVPGLTPLTQSLIAGGLVLGVLNTFLRPILRIISAPFIILTFGLFHIAINAVILYFADLYLVQLSVSGWQAMLWGSVLIGVVNSVF